MGIPFATSFQHGVHPMNAIVCCVEDLTNGRSYLCVSLQKDAKLGEENKFFYDKERGMWREQGAAAPEPAAPLAPPPVIRQLPEGTPPGAPPHSRCLTQHQYGGCFVM